MHDGHLRGLREIAREHPRVEQRFAVSLDLRPRRTRDGIESLPAKSFAERRWADGLFRC